MLIHWAPCESDATVWNGSCKQEGSSGGCFYREMPQTGGANHPGICHDQQFVWLPGELFVLYLLILNNRQTMSGHSHQDSFALHVNNWHLSSRVHLLFLILIYGSVMKWFQHQSNRFWCRGAFWDQVAELMPRSEEELTELKRVVSLVCSFSDLMHVSSFDKENLRCMFKQRSNAAQSVLWGSSPY